MSADRRRPAPHYPGLAALLPRRRHVAGATAAEIAAFFATAPAAPRADRLVRTSGQPALACRAIAALGRPGSLTAPRSSSLH
jgi:hypothetical protein